ncbi:MAG TPA: hypothetical protein VIK86_06005 [Candidatus Paceibacterota bacterium]
MIFEVQVEILGDNISIEENVEFKKHPYFIRLFGKDEKYYISIQKKLLNFEGCVPTMSVGIDGIPKITIPPNDFYQDIIHFIQHVESFGALDNRLQRIDCDNLTLRWIPENENEHISPFKEITRKKENNKPNVKITKNWLQNTVIYERQMGDLFIPFAFYRDATILFHDSRYQSAFCTFYMMLEYFFHEKEWGIAKDAYKRDLCLNTCLKATLDTLPKYNAHLTWLVNELNRRAKEYNEEGLLFILNRFRDELSHAVHKDKNRNIFNDKSFFSLAFIAMNVCLLVSIKKRLLPFVRVSEKDNFLSDWNRKK